MSYEEESMYGVHLTIDIKRNVQRDKVIISLTGQITISLLDMGIKYEVNKTN